MTTYDQKYPQTTPLGEQKLDDQKALHEVGLSWTPAQATSSYGLDLSQSLSELPAHTALVESDFIEKTGNNLLIRQASKLLAALVELQKKPTQCDFNLLQHRLIAEIRSFEANAKSQGIAAVSIQTASYLLCATLDEFVVNTPMGSTSGWNNRSLLSLFHKDTWGGEKFFHVLDSLRKNPSTNVDVLELVYLCLSLGFQGKYRLVTEGNEQLTTLRSNIYHIILGERDKSRKKLAPNWHSKLLPQPARRAITTRGVILLTLVIMGFTFASLKFALINQVNPVKHQLIQIEKQKS